jgi:DNA invertase Pin-like site-specific DNA recombinase
LFCLRNNGAHQPAKFLSGGKMDVTKILTELRQEREQIEEAIMSLERLARGRGRRRGRPPAWMSELDKKRGRPPGSKNKSTSLQKAVGLA